MSPSAKAKTGAALFILWGLIHVIGGGMILAALFDGPANAYGLYQNAAGSYPPIAGSVLGYLAYGFIWIGALVAVVGAISNWRNSAMGLALNTALVGLTDFGLVFFLVIPGYVSWAEASVGIIIFLVAATFGGLACKAQVGVETSSGAMTHEMTPSNSFLRTTLPGRP